MNKFLWLVLFVTLLSQKCFARGSEMQNMANLAENQTLRVACLWTLHSDDRFANAETHETLSNWRPLRCSSDKLIWKHDDGRVSIWSLDAEGHKVSAKEYNFPGYYPVDLEADQLLWRNAAGAIKLSKVGADGTILFSKDYGASPKWSPLYFSYGTVLWKNWETGCIRLGKFDSDGNHLFTKEYDRIPDWDVSGVSSNRILWSHSRGGRVRLWILDSNGNHISTKEHRYSEGWWGAYVNHDRIVWVTANGNVSIWKTDSDGNYISQKEYGPFPSVSCLGLRQQKVLFGIPASPFVQESYFKIIENLKEKAQEDELEEKAVSPEIARMDDYYNELGGKIREDHSFEINSLESVIDLAKNKSNKMKSHYENLLRKTEAKGNQAIKKATCKYEKLKEMSESEHKELIEQAENEYVQDLSTVGSSIVEMCFPGDTPVSVIDDSDQGYRQVPISSIRKGDLVVTCDTDASDRICSIGEVDQVISRTTNRLVNLTFKGKKLRATENHPIFVVGLNKWVQAKDLNLGDQVLSISGEAVTLEGKEVEEGEFTVYNLEVYENHNYFADEILVHNCNELKKPIPESVRSVLRKRRGKSPPLKIGVSEERKKKSGSRRCWCSLI